MKKNNFINNQNISMNGQSIDVQSIINNAMKSVQQGGNTVQTTTSFTKIVNGKQVEVTDQDIQSFQNSFINFDIDSDMDEGDFEGMLMNKPDQSVKVAVICQNCGAGNRVPKGSSGVCEYCGSPLNG